MNAIAVVLAAEGHHEPNGFMISDWNEMIWNALAFLIVVYLLVKFAGPAVTKAVKARTQRIEHELQAAEATRAEAQAASQRVSASVGGAEAEAARIVAEARESAEAMRVQLRERADQEAADLRTRARADIESSRAQAIADLREEVSQLALGAAENVVRRNLDASTQDALVENYINQVGAH